MINVTKTDLPSLKEYNNYLRRIWENHWVTNDGEFLISLEKELSKLLYVKDLVLVSNATLALLIAIRSLNLKGEVITTPFTFAASTNAILWNNLTPVFADIDPNTFNIDPKDVERKITKKTTAILAVHVYGNPCALEDLSKIAKKYNLKLILDAAHAFGVQYKGKSILDYGDISILSFHATKVFSTIEGGALYSRNKELTKKFKLLRNFGIKSEDEVVLPGINAKMNEFQAAMGLANIPGFEKKMALRKKIYDHYKTKLKNYSFQSLKASSYNYSYMPIIFKNGILRDKAYKILIENGIKARKYFHPLTSSFPFVKNNNNLPNSIKISSCVLCLPIYPDLKINDVNRIIKILNGIS